MEIATEGQRILIAEDDEQVARVLVRTLELEGYAVRRAKDGLAALEASREFRPHLIISDVNMPGMDGLSLMQESRRESNVPFIFLTARSAEEDKVAGFQAGADDYIVKPFSPAELIARVRAVIRRATVMEPQRRLAYLDLELDFGQQQARVAGTPARLSRLEFGILAHLVVNRGRIIPYDELLASIWGSEYRGERHLLQVHIQRLRRKLGEAGATREYIHNRWGVGYLVDPNGRAARRGADDGDLRPAAASG